jgi:hypothetical protein
VSAGFGQRLYLTGVGTDVTEEDLRQLLMKYTHKMPDVIDRVDMNTTLPAYVISYNGLADGAIQQFATRINGMFWHGHQVNVHVM